MCFVGFGGVFLIILTANISMKFYDAIIYYLY